MTMKYLNPRLYELIKIFDMYFRTDDKTFLNYPLVEQEAKDIFVSNAPQEAIDAFNEWKVLAKKEAEEDVKIGIVF